MTPSPPTESTVRTIVPRLPGSRMFSSATQRLSGFGSIASGGTVFCRNTPMTVCGLSRRVILARRDSGTSMTRPPRACAVVASRRTRLSAAAAGEWTRVRTGQPASVASATSFRPSAMKSPLARRFLGKARPRISLTIGLAGLVIFSTSPGRPACGSAIPRPPAEEGGGEGPAAAFFAEHQFARFADAAEPGEALGRELVDGEERGADRIGGEDEEIGVIGEQRAAGAHHAGKAREQVPDLVLRPAPELRRVEDDPVIAAAAADLALDEPGRILADRAEGQVAKARQRLVLAGPADRLPRCIDVGDVGSGPGRDERGDAGIGEEVQHLRPRLPARGDLAFEPVPVRRLLREDADMAEGGEAAEEPDAVIFERPGLAERALVAPAAVGIVVADAEEGRVGVIPVRGRQARRPQRLLLGADDPVPAVALELASVARIEEGVVGPAFGLQHHRRAAGERGGGTPMRGGGNGVHGAGSRRFRAESHRWRGGLAVRAGDVPPCEPINLQTGLMPGGLPGHCRRSANRNTPKASRGSRGSWKSRGSTGSRRRARKYGRR